MADIMVIEDDASVLDNIGDILEVHGHKVRAFARGKDGLLSAQEQPPELIICDVMMPEMDGFAVLESLRQMPETASVPFVFLTARATREDMRRGMDLGADDYLTKPFTREELLSAVQARLKKQDVIADQFDSALRTLRRSIVYALPHEIRTPLTLILGYAEVMNTDSDKLTPQEVNEMSAAILEGGRRLGRMFENYLIYAQIELFASAPEQAQMLRNAITADSDLIIHNLAMQLAEAARRPTDLILETERVAVPLSPENLTKIVDELVSNAFKFSDAGTRVYVKSARERDTFVLYVRDHGRGMTPEQVTHVGAYMQFERALYEQQGIGLGLASVKRLVELHLGTLDIRSRVGQGTLVEVRLPLG